MKKIIFILIFILLFGFACKKEDPVKPDDSDKPKEEDPIVDPDPKPHVDEKTLSITYLDDDMILSITVISESEVEETNFNLDCSREGYIFGGWFTDPEWNEPFDVSKMNDYFELGSITLYAKMERIMKDINIQIKGKLDESYVINPLFYWENNNEDDSFLVEVLLNGEVVESNEISATTYQVTNNLEVNSSYEFKVTGKQSKGSYSTSFTTVKEINNKYNDITFANPFSNGMVIQRGVETVFAGTAPSCSLLTLTIGNDNYYGISDNNGNFEVKVPEKEKSFTSINITITNGNKTKSITDVLIGDVYLFSGQSNMQWPTTNSDYEQKDLDALYKSYLRFFCQDVVSSTTPLETTKNGRWFSPNASNVLGFSAIATMTGSFLAQALKDEVPIGIITAYQGDTNIANWMSDEYYQGQVSTKHIHYNAMVYPLRHTKLTGVVWYQGCNNSAAGCEYKDQLLDLFANYRDLFNSSDLSFWVIGLACYDGDSGNNYDFSYVRESQAKACDEDDKAYFISICDDGDPTFIHPKAKRYICERVSKSIQSVIYNRDFLAEGPSYKSHSVNGNVVTIEFNNDEGLYAKGDISNLYLAGVDGKYYLATATLSNGKLIASSDKVDNPVYIKYGFGKSPFVNIFNKDDFAIVPFRTDDLNTNIDLLDYNSTDAYYFHPDGSKMTVAINGSNLAITKASDGKGYGSVRLDKWGAISYLPEGFAFKIVGTNSKASIAFRVVEGSYEIWGYKITDDFVGEKEFVVSIGDFYVMYNKQNNIFEPQKVTYVEIMVECSGACSFEVAEARFVKMDRTAPMSFIINGAVEKDDTVLVTTSTALFADKYILTISSYEASSTPLYLAESLDGNFTIDKSVFTAGKPYFINVVAQNDLGETNANNNGLVFYLKEDSEVIVCNFDFKDQAALDAYIESSMSVHASIKCKLEENGVLITTSNQGWQQFIFKLDSGAGDGMTKLVFTADFSNYNGKVVMQLADTSWNVYQYTIDLSTNKVGDFTIDFNQFVKNSTPFTTQTLMWVMFNFDDYTGGTILLDDVKLQK